MTDEEKLGWRIAIAEANQLVQRGGDVTSIEVESTGEGIVDIKIKGIAPAEITHPFIIFRTTS